MARPWQLWGTNGDTGDLQKLSCMTGFSEHPQCEQKCRFHLDFLLPFWCLVFSSSGSDDPRLVFSALCWFMLFISEVDEAQCFQTGAFPISLKPGMFIERWNHVLLSPVRFTFMDSPDISRKLAGPFHTFSLWTEKLYLVQMRWHSCWRQSGAERVSGNIAKFIL